MKKQEQSEHDRLYFIVRSFIMGQIASVIVFLFILRLGSMNFIQAIPIGTIAFIAPLIISRYFNNQVVRIVDFILKHLDRHKKLKRVILKYF